MRYVKNNFHGMFRAGCQKKVGEEMSYKVLEWGVCVKTEGILVQSAREHNNRSNDEQKAAYGLALDGGPNTVSRAYASG